MATNFVAKFFKLADPTLIRHAGVPSGLQDHNSDFTSKFKTQLLTAQLRPLSAVVDSTDVFSSGKFHFFPLVSVSFNPENCSQDVTDIGSN